MPASIGWLFVACAGIHVAEEFCFGWMAWVNRFRDRITRPQFLTFNALFILLCGLGLVADSVTFTLSLASLFLLNLLVHLVPTLIFRKYSPGLVSALVLYLPLACTTFTYAIRNGLASPRQLVESIALGAFWLGVPMLYQMARGRRR